jgi:hypothetical protein
MNKTLSLLLFFCFSIINAQSDECLKLMTKNNYGVQISLELNADAIIKFKEEVQKSKWKYITPAAILQYITLPDKNNNLHFDTHLPSYPADHYTYFYPENDYHNYLPNDFKTNLSKLRNDNSIEISTEEFRNLIQYIQKDISSKIDTNKFDYYFADKREESYKNKEFGTSVSLYNDKNEIVGRVHKFIGNKTITGHTDCDKIDYARVTIYNENGDTKYYIYLKDKKDNKILPIKEGTVFLSKRPIDLLRLEYCNLYLIMSRYAEKYNGKIIFELI